FFEKDGPRYYNSVAVADADGRVLGVYRKSHIPDGPGYQEKYYFRPGDTGFKAWTTKAGVIGVGICWDQWYPESARAMVLQGPDLLLYPTAIGSEPYDPSLDTHRQWERVMQGHAVANAVPVVAANRIGVEENEGMTQSYYGHSFIADHLGELVATFGETEEGGGVHRLELDVCAAAVREEPPPFPPFSLDTAVEKVRKAEDAWNIREPQTVALAYTQDSVWRNRGEFLRGRAEIVAFLTRKWNRELDYRLIKELWTFGDNRIAVRFAYEWHDDSGHWFRSYGN